MVWRHNKISGRVLSGPDLARGHVLDCLHERRSMCVSRSLRVPACVISQTRSQKSIGGGMSLIIWPVGGSAPTPYTCTTTKTGSFSTIRCFFRRQTNWCSISMQIRGVLFVQILVGFMLLLIELRWILQILTAVVLSTTGKAKFLEQK